MYHVKQLGRNGFHFFTEGLQERVMNKISIEQQLRSGTLQSQLLQYYQPVIDAKNFNICGAEMLLRWNHPTKGILSPGDFLDDVEELGFLSEIDSESRHSACKQLAEWRLNKLVDDNFRLAINAGEQSLKDESFQTSIKSDLDNAGLTGNCLSIEVTEGVLVSDFDKTSMILNKIKKFGVNVAIDDFGTGYSSMAYLKWLPASILKVDRSFVQNVPDSASDCRVLKAIITLAKSLDLDVIVEGVETVEQARLCCQYGADMFQGYLFSKPLSPNDFASFVENYHPKLLKAICNA
jgi:EAL domain-containing protein (putative c-di-GMP-specific phosphodiesterase class I)